MDTRRKAIIWVCALLIVATSLYPPWIAGVNQINEGYGWLFRPPIAIAHVDLSRLLIPWVMIAAIGAGLFCAWPYALTRTGQFLGRHLDAVIPILIGIPWYWVVARDKVTRGEWGLGIAVTSPVIVLLLLIFLNYSDKTQKRPADKNKPQ
jgi:hypothetical protein